MPQPDDPVTTDSLYGRLERLAFAAGAVIMLAIVAASAWLSINTEARLGDAAAAQQIRAASNDLLQGVITAETGQRGYLLTGKDTYLAPYRRATGTVTSMLKSLDDKMGSDTDYAQIKRNILAKMAELGHTVALTQGGKRDDALAVVQSDLGQTLMDDITAVARRMGDHQRRALVHDLGASRVGAQALVIIDTVALVLLTLLTTFVASSVNRSVLRLRRTRAALQDANAALGSANAALEASRDSLEDVVRERTAELTLANEEIQRFAYIVSHDLRAPLLNIIGFTSELEAATATLNGFVQQEAGKGAFTVPEGVRAASDEDLPEAIRFIQTSTAKMDRLINAILRLSREGRRVLIPEKLDMTALLRASIDTVRHQADLAEAEVTLGEIPPIVSDRIAVDQIFSNLIDNALKYLADGRPGRIAIDGTREGRLVTITVADNGRGIAARDMERVFELFRRAGNQNRPGEGIGLAHVKALVRRLGGAIECSSRLGEGSVFSVRLPSILTHGGIDPA